MASQRQRESGVDAQPNPNVFDDEYETDVPDTELDHRPGERRSAGQEPETSVRARSRTPSQGRRDRRSTHGRESSDANLQQRALRNSIAKDPRDLVGARSAATRAPSQDRTRPISRFSTATGDFAHYEDRSGTPVHGRSGSGYANGFSQSGLPRLSGSSHTISRRPSEYSVAVPAFPYALYNQNTVQAEDDASVAGVPAVGFPGARRNNDFERRIGPDGEEQDIIGPDGHTEQLPPYSRYPDGQTKVAAVGAAATSGATPAALSVSPGLASPAVEAPQRTPGLERGIGNASSSSSQSSIVEKKWNEKTFKEKRRTKICCGIPLWMLATVVGVVLLCGVIIGATVGGLMANAPKRPTRTVTASPSLLDASPIASPTGAMPVPTGTYVMPFGIPQEQQRSCILNGDQFNTWACNTPDGNPAVVKVGNPPNGFQFMQMMPNTTMPVANASQPLLKLGYGAQYPNIQAPQRMYWVTDLEDPSRGPALHFQTLYDKLVILNDDQFRPSSKAKRAEVEPEHFDDFISLAPSAASSSTPAPLSFSVATNSPLFATSSSSSAPSSAQTGDPDGSDFGRRKNILQTGERPWFCWWNATWIEGFVYMDTYHPSLKQMKHKVYARDEQLPMTTAAPSVEDAYTQREIKPEDADYEKAQAMFTSARGNFEKRWANADPPPASASAQYIPPAPTDDPLGFPYIMKVQERRIPCEQEVAPYCQKMLILPGMAPVPLQGNDGKPIIVQIQEDSPSFKDQLERFNEDNSAKASSSSKRKRDDGGHKQLAEMFKRDDIAGSCHCHWVTPPPPN